MSGLAVMVFAVASFAGVAMCIVSLCKGESVENSFYMGLQAYAMVFLTGWIGVALFESGGVA